MQESHDHILTRLQKEARQLRLGVILPEGDLPWELVQRVRASFIELLAAGGVTLDQVAEHMGDGYSRGTLSRFRNLTSPDDYCGNLDRVVRGVNQFMETLARRAEARSQAPDGWVETYVAQRMLVVISKTIELSSIGLIYSDAGRGKSMTMQAAAAIHPGSILVRINRGNRTPRGLAMHLAKLLGIRGVRDLASAEQKVMDRLRGTGRALLIDEAHQVQGDTLELLRDLHDACDLPIVLAGTVRIREMANDPDVLFGQFSSRVALWYDVTEDLRGDGGGDPTPLHSVEEIRKLYERDKVRFETDAAALLAKIANLPGLGGLRLCAKIVQVAAAASGDAPISARLVMKVIRTMRGRTVATDQVVRALDASRVQVA